MPTKKTRTSPVTGASQVSPKERRVSQTTNWLALCAVAAAVVALFARIVFVPSQVVGRRLAGKSAHDVYTIHKSYKSFADKAHLAIGPAPTGFGPLHYVARSARHVADDRVSAASLITDLVAEGVEVTVVDGDGMTALHHAVSHREWAVAKTLLSLGALPDAAGTHGGLAGVTPLHYAMGQSLQDAVIICRQALGENTRLVGQSALAEGIQELPAVFAEVLGTHLERAAVVEQAEPAAVFRAVHAWGNAFARMLLETPGGVKNINSKEARFGRTPLHMAALQGNSDGCAVLVRNRADISKQDRAGHTPIHLAAMWGHYSVVQELLGLAPESVRHMRDQVGRTVQDVFLPSDRRAYPLPVDDVGDNGGWGMKRLGEDQAAHCDVEVVEDGASVDFASFYARFLSIGRPVLLRGAARRWNFRKSWQRHKFLKAHGDLPVGVAAIPYASHFGGEERNTTLEAFWRGHLSVDGGQDPDAPLYVFKNLRPEADLADQRLLDSVPMPPKFLEGIPRGMLLCAQDRSVDGQCGQWIPQFYSGEAGTGAPPHFHSDAWNALAFGEKRWWLYPRSQAPFSTMPAIQWSQSPFPRAFVCDQQAGDVLYVPAGWGHAVLNVRNVVGVAVEFRFTRNFL